MSGAAVLLKHDGLVTHLTLNRPEKLNALDSSIVEQAISGVAEAAENKSRLLVISGDGRSFSAGFDLSNLDQQTDAELVLRFIRIETLLQAIQNAPMATLALVHGRCFGAAADILCVCDHRITAPGTTFRMPGLRFGIVLGTRRLASLIGPDKARKILETSKTFDTEEAVSLGMAQQIILQDDWESFIFKQAEIACSLDSEAQNRMLKNTRSCSNDSDLAELVRSLSVPGLVERIKRFTELSK